jgi:hypothetical protein
LDTAKQYLVAVANVRDLYQISIELRTNINYKDKTRHTLKLLAITISASSTWWDDKLEKIKKYSVLKLGNELYRSTNKEQEEIIVINCEELEQRVIIELYVHHKITIIPFNKSDPSPKSGLPNQDAQKNVGK